MGKITRVFLSDDLGNPNYHNGGGEINSILNNFSSSKKSERLVLNIEVVFDDLSKRYIVLKIAPLFEPAHKNYSTYYHNRIDSDLTPEKSLLNKYYHEAKMYQFFSDKAKTDSTVAKYVLKSVGSGIFDIKGIIELERPDNQKERVYIFNNREIYNLVLNNNWSESSYYGFVYIATEFRPDSRNLADGLNFQIRNMPASAKKTKKDRLTRHFVDSTINLLKYLSNTYNFCHWDFHPGNVRYNSINGNIELFDFDLSTVNHDIIKNSHYIQYIPGIYYLVKNIVKNNKMFNVHNGYYLAKTKLIHYYDLFQFIDYIVKISDQDTIGKIDGHENRELIFTVIKSTLFKRKYIEPLVNYIESEMKTLNEFGYTTSFSRVKRYFDANIKDSEMSDDECELIEFYINSYLKVSLSLRKNPQVDYLNRIFCGYYLFIKTENSKKNKIEKVEVEQKQIREIPEKIPIKVRNIGELYQKDIQKCFEKPRNGGYKLPELRKIARLIGVDQDKLDTRTMICNELQRLLNVNIVRREKKIDCVKFKTNKGSKCPNCCSEHYDECKWVRGRGCQKK